MTAAEYYQAGKLGDAITAATEAVKAKPGEAQNRGLLAELLCFSGDLGRADTHLDLIAMQSPDVAIGVSLFRQLVRAEQARQQLFGEGRVPEFLDKPSEEMGLRLQASIALREKKEPEAKELIDRAEALRPACPGVCDGHAFADFRDLDDLCAGFFEVLTSTGKYYWIPVSRVESVEFHPPERPRDLIWRRARMVVLGGPDGEVFLPSLYAGTSTAPDEGTKLGRLTDWRGGDGTAVRGIGQRTFLLGDQDRPILEMTNLEFTSPKPGEAAAS